MPQQNASLSWIVTLVVFAFLVGVLVGVLIMNNLNQPAASQLSQPPAAPATSQQTVSQVSEAARAAAPPNAAEYASVITAGFSTAFYKFGQAIAQATDRVAELDKTLRRLADIRVQLAQADFQIKQQKAALDAAAQDRALAHAERAALGLTLSVITLEIVTALMIGVLALIFVAVWQRLRQPPAAPQIAPRADHDRTYWLKMRLTAQENERTERRQRLRQKTVSVRSSHPYHDLPLAVMDDEA
jgi:hypothetical protein